MSANAATATIQTQAQAEEAGEAHALAFRIAFAAAVGLTLGEVLGWDFPFLPAMLAVQLLSGREPLSVKKGVAFVAVMAAACAFAVLVAQIFVDSPLVLLLVVSLVTFLAFLLLARGQAAGVAAMFLITTAVVPLLATESMSVAHGFIYSLIAGSALAVLLTFAAQAFFPMRVQARPVSAPAQKERDAVAVALANAAVLMSLVIYFMLTVSPVSIVGVLTVIGILRQPADLGGGTAFGLILGNLVGGLAATAAYLLVTLLPSPAFLLLVVLLVGLLFGDRIARGGEQGPIYTVALITFLIVLGLGISPLPQDSGSLFIARVFDVMVAAVYAIGMASLLRSAFRAR
ncbi:MAG TPA: DUF2955 domain-containing protein [Methyloceanibacter sp.]|jgi:hypothetical protein